MTLATREYGTTGKVLMVDDKVTTDPFARVWLDTPQVDGKLLPTKALMIEGSDEEPVFIANHSDRYRLVANSLVSQVVEDVMTRAEVAFKHWRTVWDGKRFTEQYITPDRVIGTEDDKVHFGVEGINSYDGSLQFGVRFFMHRLVCSNGLYAMDRLGGFLFRHTKEADGWDVGDAIEGLRAGSRNFMAMAPWIEALQNIHLDLPGFLAFHAKVAQGVPKWPSTKTASIIQTLAKETAPNLWHLVNCYTAVTSHEMNPITSAKLADRILDCAFEEIEMGPASPEDATAQPNIGGLTE